MILSKNDSHHAMMTTTNNNNQSIDPDTNRSRQSYHFLKKKNHILSLLLLNIPWKLLPMAVIAVLIVHLYQIKLYVKIWSSSVKIYWTLLDNDYTTSPVHGIYSKGKLFSAFSSFILSSIFQNEKLKPVL